MATQAPRVQGFDGLRAVAVMLVIARHFARDQVPGGFIGVDIFFALSGYLITSILVVEFSVSDKINLLHFYARRAARLMPALLILLLATVIVRSIERGHLVLTTDVILAATYTLNWARAFGMADSIFLGHTWSLAIEEQFYLLWPPLLLLSLRWRPRSAPAVAVCLAVVSLICSALLCLCHFPTSRTYNGFDSRAVELLVGCAAAFLPPQSKFAQVLTRCWPIPIVVLLFSLCVHDSTPLLPLGGYCILAIMGSWLIIAIRNNSAPAAVLEWPPLLYIGRVSYGIYLWHYFILGLCVEMGLHNWEKLLFALPVTLAIAAVSYHYVEVPILKATRNRLSPAHNSLIVQNG